MFDRLRSLAGSRSTQEATVAYLCRFAASAVMATSIQPMSVGAAESPVVVADRAMLWIVQQGVELPNGETGVRLIHTPAGDWFSKHCRFPLRRGEVYCAAAVSGRLHVFFGDGTHYRFERTAEARLAPSVVAVRQRSLPGRFLPLAVAGDPAEGVLLAIVPVHIVARIVEENQRRERLSAEESEEQPPEASKPSRTVTSIDEMSGRYWLIRYARHRWEPAEALPDFFKPSGPVALTLSDTTLALCWRSPELGPGADLQYAERADGVWNSPETVPGAGQLKNVVLEPFDVEPVLAGLRPAQEDPLACEVVMFRRKGGRWASSTLHEKNGRVLSVPSERTGLGMCGRQAVVVVAGEPEGIRWGLWSAESEEPVGDLMPIPRLELPQPTVLSGRWVQIASYLCLVSLMTAAFWRRRSSVLAPADLPEGLRPAGLGRRSAGFVLDLLPALVVTTPLWGGQLQAFLNAAVEYAGEPERVQPFLERLWVPTLWVRGVYVAYCLGWELWRGSTPGKMAVRSVACSLDGRPCTPRQVVTRNLFRIVELEPLLLIWPLLLLLVMTRNRQRLGDIWAGTLVIEFVPV
jgi:uncharacterized RDD family membrane protein YckC